MPTRVVFVNIDEIGEDSGPFTISDNVLGVLATNVSRTALLGGYQVNSDVTATEITIESTGPCDDSVTIPIDFVVCPPPPPPNVEWYQLQVCSDLTFTTSTSYPIGTFAVNDRVTDANGVVYIVTLVYTTNPGGALISITDTGFTGCPPPQGVWTIYNYDCGFGTINDIGINGNFMGSLPLGPSTFPLTSTLSGSRLLPNGVVNGNNTVQANVTTNLPGPGNCAIMRIYKNGSPTPSYSLNFSSNPTPTISGVNLSVSDNVLVEIQCYPNPCPPPPCTVCYTVQTGTIPVSGGASSTSTGTITVTGCSVNVWAKYNSAGTNSGTANFGMTINSINATGVGTITGFGQTFYSNSNGSTGSGYITLAPGTYNYTLVKIDNYTSGNTVIFSYSTGTDPLSSINMQAC